MKKVQLNKICHQPLIWFGSACVPLSKSPEINFHACRKAPSSFQIPMSRNDASLELVATWTILEVVILKIHKLEYKKPPYEVVLSWFGYGALKFCSA